MGQGRAFHIDAQHIAAKAPCAFSSVSEGPVESLELGSRLVNVDLKVVDPADPQLADAVLEALTLSTPSMLLLSRTKILEPSHVVQLLAAVPTDLARWIAGQPRGGSPRQVVVPAPTRSPRGIP